MFVFGPTSVTVPPIGGAGSLCLKPSLLRHVCAFLEVPFGQVAIEKTTERPRGQRAPFLGLVTRMPNVPNRTLLCQTGHLNAVQIPLSFLV